MESKNTSVVVKHIPSITPKILDAAKMVLGSLSDELHGVVDQQAY